MTNAISNVKYMYNDWFSKINESVNVNLFKELIDVRNGVECYLVPASIKIILAKLATVTRFWHKSL